MKIFYIIFIIVITGLQSCNTNENNTTKQVLSDVDCFPDTSTYLLMTFYDNGIVKQSGYIKNQKSEGQWFDYYWDGMLRRTYTYENGTIAPPINGRQSPKMIFENDSLKIGVKTRVRILNLHPNEQLKASNNVKVEKLDDNSDYDYALIPLEGDIASFFYFEEMTGINLDVNYEEFAKSIEKTKQVKMT